MAFSYNKKNLANTTITGAITPTQTSVTVADATVFSYAFFYATLMPSNEMSNASNSEIVLVTNIQGNTLTLVRGQENTIARSFPYGAVITNGIYTRDIDYARSIGRKVFMAQDDGTNNTNTSYQITDPMIKNIPEEGSIITVEFDTPSYGSPTLGVNNGVGGLVQVSGTDIHITDSSGQIDSVEMYGDTQQQTYSGNNLYDVNNTTLVSEGVSTDDEGWITITANNTSGSTIYLNYFTARLNISTNTQYDVFMEVKNVSGNGNLTVVSNHSSAQFTTNTAVALSSLQNNTVYKYTKTSKSSFTGVSTSLRTFISFNSGVSGSIKFRLSVLPNSDISPDDFVYEPYVGGVVSPNPDYPQTVQVVTGEQTITISDGDSQSQTFNIGLIGKNRFNKDTAHSGYYVDKTNGELVANASNNASDYIDIAGLTNVVITISSSNAPLYALYDDNKQYLSGGNYNNGVAINVTGASYIRFTIPTAVQLSIVQLEEGSTATAYESFRQVELCKIGDYQDYIYKSGEDWYVHKETGKGSLDGSETWNKSATQTNGFTTTNAFTEANTGADGYSDYFIYAKGNAWQGIGKCGINQYYTFWCQMMSDLSLADFKTWLTRNTPTIYYVLTTPTDTQITNSALITQLEALYNMLPEGVADVVVTGDLPGSLTIKYYQQGTGTYTAPIVGGAEIDGGDNEQVVELDSYLPYRLVYDTNGYWRVLNKGPKVTTGAIMDGAVTPAKLSVDPGKYSAVETIIGSWIDGRPIYRKVFSQTVSSVLTNITHGITNFAFPIKVYGYLQGSNQHPQVIPRVVPDNAAFSVGVGDFTSVQFSVIIGTSVQVPATSVIVVEYVKTS